MNSAEFENRCPVCSTSLFVPTEKTFGAQNCPQCRAELWFLGFSGNPLFFTRRPGETSEDFLLRIADQRLGITAEEMSAVLKTGDSLDMVELLTELDEQLRSRY